jgi:predicted dehydrogenase
MAATHATLGWGILGTGNIASQFAAGLAGAKLGKLVAAASRSAQSAEAFAQRCNIGKAYENYQQLLGDDQVQAVYISLPNALHHEWTLKALAAGKHVLCEKPVANDLAQAKEMFAAARAANRLLVEAFMYRSHPLMQAVLHEVRIGRIGRVRLIRSSFCYQTSNLGNIRFSKALAGGGLMDVGCYCIDFARLVTGLEPVEVKATGVICETGVDDLFSGTMVFPDGVLATFTCGMRVQADNLASICGEGGYLEIPVPWKPPVTDAEYRLGYSTPPKMDDAGKRNASREVPPRQRFVVNAHAPLYAMEADAFAQAVQGGEPAVSEKDSLANMAILDQMREQIGLQW